MLAYFTFSLFYLYFLLKQDDNLMFIYKFPIIPIEIKMSEVDKVNPQSKSSLENFPVKNNIR